MPETGIRYLAPSIQGTGDALTIGNAAAASNRLTVEAALKAAAVADPNLKAAGSPTNIAIEIHWRADLGNYTGIGSFLPTSAHGGVSATRQLRHVSVDASDVEIPHSVVRNHATLTTTATGEANVVQIVGTRTADPRAANEKDRIINMGTVARYATTLDRAFTEVEITSGKALKTDGTVFDYGTGIWASGNVFETISSRGYDFVRWDGFKWTRYQHVLAVSSNASCTTYSYTDNFFENLKGFIRNTTDTEFTITVDGLYGRGCAQACFRFDYGSHHSFSNLDIDAQLIVGEPNPTAFQFGTGTVGSVGFVTIDSFYLKNWWDAVDTIGDYQQGDGFVGNRGCHDIYITNGAIENCGDGGIDDKSYATDPNGYALYVENVTATYCKRSYRIHGGNDPSISGGGIFNYYYFKNVKSIRPWGDAHLHITGGVFTWENPGGAIAMTDEPTHAAPQPSAVTPAGDEIDHVLVTLRDLTYSRNAGAPAVDASDNTGTYPTEASAEAANTFRILVQEVTGAGWEGDILVDGVVYNFTTVPVTEGDTIQVAVTELGTGQVAFSVNPAGTGVIDQVNATTANIRWNNTDGSSP